MSNISSLFPEFRPAERVSYQTMVERFVSWLNVRNSFCNLLLLDFSFPVNIAATSDCLTSLSLTTHPSLNYQMYWNHVLSFRGESCWEWDQLGLTYYTPRTKHILPFTGAQFDGSGRPSMSPNMPLHLSHFHNFQHLRGPFMRCLHFAIMALGPWEGRAVAFVLDMFFSYSLTLFPFSLSCFVIFLSIFPQQGC